MMGWLAMLFNITALDARYGENKIFIIGYLAAHDVTGGDFESP